VGPRSLRETSDGLHAPHRLVAWKDTENPKAAPVFIELFDHKIDPAETVNVAEENPKLVTRLLKRLNAGWKAARPKP